ncbi:MAG: hypothetical protein GY762_15665 [Proteobacteria bacterium]|nr:hypothetical protein [Pseudomonadota bacterium]
MNNIFPAWVLLALITFWGCQNNDSDNSLTDGGGDTDINTDTRIDWEALCAAGDPIDTGAVGSKMVGTWGMLLNLGSKQTKIPSVGALAADSRTWALVHLTSDGAYTYTATEKVCAIQNLTEKGEKGQVITPDAFVQNVKVLTRTVTVDEEAPCAEWISDDVWEVRGVNLDNEKEDPLPGNGSIDIKNAIPCENAEPGVACDQDGDGHAGMTNTLTGFLSCDVYITQRWHAQLGGYIIDENTIAGPIISADSEQTILGATKDSICSAVNPGTVPILDKCPDHFYFIMKRFLSDDVTCGDVMELTSCDESQFSCAGKTDYPLNPTAAVFADLPGYIKDECHLSGN